MSDDSDETKGLLDDDPALDFILYQEMVKEHTQPANKSGCLGFVLICLLPIGSLVFWANLVSSIF